MGDGRWHKDGAYSKVEGDLLVVALGLGVEARSLVGLQLESQSCGSDIADEAGNKASK